MNLLQRANAVTGWLALAWLCVATEPAAAQTHFAARLDASQVVNNPSTSLATGQAQMVLNADQTELRYAIQFDGLDLEPIAANRTDPNDILAVHIHLHVQDVIGPHILNIFGVPGFDDDDLVIDYWGETFTCIYDISYATRDPDTGELLPQSFPLTTKLFPTSFRLAELLNEQWYFAVHTVANQATPPGVTIRGNFFIVPEPTGSIVVMLPSLLWPFRRRRT